MNTLHVQISDSETQKNVELVPGDFLRLSVGADGQVEVFVSRNGRPGLLMEMDKVLAIQTA